MKVLFALHDLGFADHIAIAHLSAIAKQAGHQTYFSMLDNLQESLEKIKPEVVAYSVNILGFPRVVEANMRAKQRHHFVSIMGGPQATFFPETFPQSGMDAYCIGEGDYAFRDFLANIFDFSIVPNLITRISHNAVRPLIRDLDELPAADRDLVLANSFLSQSSKKTFYATRGCPFSCAYCCNSYYHQLYAGQSAVRRFSVERIINEILAVRRKYRMDFVKFGDDCFAIQADEWLEHFAFLYNRAVGLSFNCYLRIDMIEKPMLKLLKEAGCHSLNLSIDSVSPYIREHVLNRHMQSENLIEKLQMVREYGIKTFVNYMLAIPESTLQDDIDTIKQGRRGRITWQNYTTAVPMERTPFYNYCVKKGELNPLTYQGDMSDCNKPSVLSCFSEKEKRIRYNIFLFGDLIAKMPAWLGALACWLIKIIPPNKWFIRFNEWRYRYYMEKEIFEVKDNFRIPRFWQREGHEQTP